MLRQEKAHIIKEILNRFYPTPEIPLQHEDPYTLLIAVLLSAQSTDARVNTITPNLFAKAKTPQEMILLSVEEIKNIIKPCGLGHTKATAIWKLSKQLLISHQGAVPKTFEELESLPGIGHKTASVVMSQAFDVPAFPVDTHIHRCARRWGLSKGLNVKKTEEDLKKTFKKEDWNRLHLQMIFYARKYCPARGHIVAECPICSIICRGKLK